MPSALTKSVQGALAQFVKQQTCDDQNLPIDVLRTIRDETEKMMERQRICDTFDADPLHLFEDDDDNLIRNQVNRLFVQTRVLSFSRTDTKGYTSIESVVEIQRDSSMKNVNDSIRLTFSFERNQIRRQQYTVRSSSDNVHQNFKEDKLDVGSDSDCNNCHKDECNASNDRKRKRSKCVNDTFGTDVTYRIDLSKDHSKKERLIDIYVQAPGISPSINTAVFLEEDIVGQEEEGESFDEFDANGDLMKSTRERSNSEAKHEHKVIKSKDSADDTCNDCNDDTDKYAAFVDPDVMQNFLQWTGLEFDVQNALFFLMTFPYYEHEWDIFGFLLSCVFGDEDEESMETVHDGD